MLSKRVKSLANAKKCSSIFNSNYLINVLDMIKNEKDVTVFLGEDTILKIEGKDEKEKTHCLLAPVITDKEY